MTAGPEASRMPERRPLQSRDAAWAKRSAAVLAGLGISPNTISVVSIAFAALSCAAFVLSGRFDGLASSLLLVAAAIGIQLRLLCNLLDGMVAIEHGKKSPVGGIYNEAPDRVADILIIVGAGYAIRAMPFAIELAWLDAVLAVLTAYVRALGQSLGTPSFFVGPMAKPHRMATLTVASLVAAALVSVGWSERVLFTALAVIALGCVITGIRRLMFISGALRSASP
jgi:phosphatidylglycerophosphate synthase